ncbi:neurotrypsin-like [Patiria miniata]|uniref:SRCR domain-containing protein n=1 Tax=Patiria miniata TaxID=46514 RepID=A0A914A245_PATMI|nr:neurotrypsin-like [Patiria miniata]
MTTFCVGSVIVLVVCGLFSSGQAQFDEGTVRLSRVINGHSGYVEIYHDQQWGRVCDTDWDDVDAGVVCIQLGYIGGNLPAADFSDPPDTGLPIVLDEVNCLGDETVLIECNKGEWDHFETGCMTATVECIPHETTMSMAVLTTKETILPVATTKQPQMPNMQSTQSPLPGTSDNTVTYVVISVLSVALVVTIAAIIVYAVRKRMKRGRGQRNSPGLSSPEYMVISERNQAFLRVS